MLYCIYLYSEQVGEDSHVLVVYLIIRIHFRGKYCSAIYLTALIKEKSYYERREWRIVTHLVVHSQFTYCLTAGIQSPLIYRSYLRPLEDQ